MIVFYDYNHKANLLSSVMMGLCRFMVYLSVALCCAVPPPGLIWIGGGLLLVALYFLKRRRPGDIPRAVVSLIAGISLFDTMLIATATGAIGWALLAAAGFLVIPALQRFIPGT